MLLELYVHPLLVCAVLLPALPLSFLVPPSSILGLGVSVHLPLSASPFLSLIPLVLWPPFPFASSISLPQFAFLLLLISFSFSPLPPPSTPSISFPILPSPSSLVLLSLSSLQPLPASSPLSSSTLLFLLLSPLSPSSTFLPGLQDHCY